MLRIASKGLLKKCTDYVIGIVSEGLLCTPKSGGGGGGRKVKWDNSYLFTDDEELLEVIISFVLMEA
jgi:hypothetical protein